MAKAASRSAPKAKKPRATVRATPEPEFPLLTYVDGLVEELRGRVPKALRQWDEESIHQARVATRRLKAAIDLLEPVTTKRHRKQFGRVLRRLRRRLGPLRDADVMLGHLETLGKGTRLRPAVAFLSQHLCRQRATLREASRREAPPARVLAKLGSYWAYREEVAEVGEAVDALLAESLHLQLDAFAEQADRLIVNLRARRPAAATAASHEVAEMPVPLTTADADRVAPGEPPASDGATGDGPRGGVEAPSPDAGHDGSPAPAVGRPPAPPAEHQDPHELRISGKILRYTLEMAAVQGHKLPKATLKLFKAMQEHLGLWHDYVVLSDQALRASLDELLAHHDPHLQEQVLDLSRAVLRRSVQQIDAFAKMWTDEGGALSRAIRAAFPLTKPVESSPATEAPAAAKEPAPPEAVAEGACPAETAAPESSPSAA